MIEDDFGDFINDCKQQFPEGTSLKEQKYTLDILQKSLYTQRKDIKKILENPNFLNDLVSEFQKQEKHMKQEDLTSPTAFISLLGKSLINSGLNSMYPFLGTLAFSLAGAAAEKIFEFHKGQPKGGIDLCAGIVFGCLQGYITEQGKEWDGNQTQFNRQVVQTGNSDQNDHSAYLQLRDCLSEKKMGPMMVEVQGGGAKQACTAQSSIWHYTQVNMQATNIPKESCSNLQNTFLAESQKCMNTAGHWKQGAIIFGYFLAGAGGLALLVALSAAVYYTAKRGKCPTPNNC